MRKRPALLALAKGCAVGCGHCTARRELKGSLWGWRVDLLLWLHPKGTQATVGFRATGRELEEKVKKSMGNKWYDHKDRPCHLSDSSSRVRYRRIKIVEGGIIGSVLAVLYYLESIHCPEWR